MKTHHSIIAILLATTLLATAQEPVPSTPRRIVVVPSPSTPRRIVDAPSGGAEAAGQPNALATNYQIIIAGSLGKTDPVDVTLRGSSLVFSATLQNPIRRIEVKLMNEKDSLTVVYSIGAQIAINTGENAAQYQDASVTGSFLATLGQPFPILQIGDSKLTIQVDKIAEKK
jgi:hypothetical protein